MFSKETYISKIPTEVTNLLKQVQSLTKGYTVYIGGGFLRDLYTSWNTWYNASSERIFDIMFEPKDVDLIFIPNGDMEKVLPVLPKTYINYDKSASEISEDLVKRGITHLRGIFVPNLTPTTDVQFIVYDKHLTIEEVAADFDCNINQVMYNVEQGWYHTEAFEKGHKQEVIEMLHTFDENRMIARLVRMHRKFPHYNVISDLEWEDKHLDSDYIPERGGSDGE